MSEEGLYKNQPLSKSQPARASDGSKGDKSGYKKTEHREFGDMHDFNHKGKITNNSGSDYHDLGRANSGLYGNFAEKDKQNEYLKERGMKGQEIHHFNGTNEHKKIYPGTGVTAYNTNPNYEVFSPATGHNAVPSRAVIRPTVEREENIPLVKQDKETKRLKK